MNDRFARLAARAGSSIQAFISLKPEEILTPEAARKNGGRDVLWLAWSYADALGNVGELERCVDWSNGAMAYASAHDPGPLWWAEMATTLGENLERTGELGKAATAYDVARGHWASLVAPPEARTGRGRPTRRDATLGAAVEEMVRALQGKEEPAVLPAGLTAQQRANLRERWRVEHAGPRYSEVLSALIRIGAATGQLDLARSAHAELAAWNERSGELTGFGGSRDRLRTAYSAAMSLAEIELAAGNVEESERLFGEAVNVYYQNVFDENELLLLVRAMFNQANSWVRLGRYDEAINVYRMIASDFDRYGDEEAALRIRYAELFALWKRDPATPILDDLRRLIGEYEAYASRHADSRNRNVHKRQLEAAYSLLLSLIAGQADPPLARIGDCLAVIAASRQPEALSGVGDAADNTADDVYALADKAAVLEAYLTRLPGTVVLFLESGVDELVLLAFEGGDGPGPRCVVASGSADLLDGLFRQYELYVEELDLIADGRAPLAAPASAELVAVSEAVWRELPATIRDMLRRASTLLVSAAPGGLDRVPLELVRTEDGWLGQDTVIARVPTLRALLELLCPNRLPHVVDDAAYVFRAEDPPEMGRLRAADEEAQDAVTFAELIGLRPTAAAGPDRQALAEAFDAGYRLVHYVGHGLAGRFGEILPVTAEQGLEIGALGTLRGHKTPTVILSACDVGRGRSLPGGNVKGFAVQLLHHGAPGVIASMQAVPDAAQPAIIEALYRGLAEAPLGGAILQQRRQLAEDGLSPILWSLLCLFGDPNHTVSPLAPGHPARTADLTDDWAAAVRRAIASGRREEVELGLRLVPRDWPGEAADDRAEVTAWLRAWAARLVAGGDSPAGDVADDTARLALCGRVAAYDVVGGVSLRLLLAAERIGRTEASGAEREARSVLREAVDGMVACAALADSICWTRFALWLVDEGVAVYPLYQIMEVLRQASSNATCLRDAGDRYAALVGLVDHQSELYQGKLMFDVAKMDLSTLPIDA